MNRHLLLTGAICALLLFSVFNDNSLKGAENISNDRPVLAIGGRLLPPPVEMAESEREEITEKSAPLTRLPIAKISITNNKEADLKNIARQRRLSYEYLKKNISLVRKQLGSGFEIVQDGMFIFASDAGETLQVKQAVNTLKICKEALKKDFFNSNLRNPVTVFAFKDRESYKYNLKRIWQESPISPYGHYNYVRKHIIFNLSTGLGTMIHELTHALMDPDMPKAPIWLAEGMASLYEQCVVDGNTIRGAVNWRLPELQRKLHSEIFTSLEELLQMSDSDFKVKESLNYAEARYFCMYLEQRGVLRKVYKDFRDNYNFDKSGRIFIENAFSNDLTEIEKNWKRWINTLSYQQENRYSFN